MQNAPRRAVSSALQNGENMSYMIPICMVPDDDKIVVFYVASKGVNMLGMIPFCVVPLRRAKFALANFATL